MAENAQGIVGSVMGRIVRTYEQDAALLGQSIQGARKELREEKKAKEKGVVVEKPLQVPTFSSPQPPPLQNQEIQAPPTRVDSVPQPQPRERFQDRGDIKERVAALQKSLTKEVRKEVGSEKTLPQTEESRGRTFLTDANNRLRRDSLSPLSGFTKTRGATQRNQIPRKQSSSLSTILGILLLLIGVGVVAGSVYLLRPPAEVPIEVRVETPIAVNEQESVRGDAFLQEVVVRSQNPVKTGTIVHLHGTLAYEDGSEDVVPITSLIEELGGSSSLVRSLEAGGMVALFGENGSNEIIVISPISSFERAFRGMLTWESSIASLGSALFGTLDTEREPVEVPILSYATSTPTSSSTPPASPMPPYTPAFKDRTLSNVDVRILYDAEDRAHILYGFPQRDMLVIATSEAAFKEAVYRLSRE